MSDPDRREPDWRTWPALADLGHRNRWRFNCAQGIWGRAATGAAAPSWLAASAGFDPAAQARAAALLPNAGDAPAPLWYWHSDRQGWQAGCVGPVPPGDTPDPRCRVLDWPHPVAAPTAVPTALVALALLPRVAEPSAVPAGPLPVENIWLDTDGVAALIATGIGALAGQLDFERLTAIYAAVLDGAPLIALPADLPASALAVLLLPLEPALAERISLYSRAPTSGPDPTAQTSDSPGAASRIHLVGLPAKAPPGPATPASRAHATRLAAALLANDPQRLVGGPTAPAPRAAGPPAAEPATRTLRLWGAASSGKTVYLAQLFSCHRRGGDWSVRVPPDGNAEWFAKRLDGFRRQGHFPPPTPPGTSDHLAYWLVNERTGERAAIAVEDRPGAESEVVDAETARRLAAADGLLLLLDPLRDAGQQADEVRRGLLAMQQARGSAERDPRPLAVCVSKCDALIETIADYQRARDESAAFLQPHLAPGVSEALDHYWSPGRYRLFPLSAVGVREQHGALLPVVFYDEHLDLRTNHAGVPLNLLEPLLWLLAEAGP